jgi:hypothetical protein
MSFFRIQYPAGDSVIGEFDTAPATPPGGRVDEVPRLPALGEDWDVISGEFVLDVAVAADEAVGPAHIEKMRRLKYLEAVVIKSGYALTMGLLFEEAAIREVSLDDMAGLVMAQVDAEGAVAAEINRMTLKAGAQVSDQR